MANTVREVMTPAPLSLHARASVAEAARLMRANDVGAVLVMNDDDTLCGIVTDRDVVVRVVAESHAAENTELGSICSHDVAQLSPEASIKEAVQIMRERAVRRIPVIEGGKPIGILSIGDLAITQDPSSALGAISAAPPNT